MRHRRSGLTLMEVLISIFIMGVGMLAVLVLFPLGALSMARALKDDRCGSIAANADSMAAARDLRTDANVFAALGGAPAGFLPPDPNGAGYPVFVDPYALNGDPTLTTVGTAFGGFTTSPIVRVKPSYINTPQDIDQWFSLLDDLTFDPNGLPVNFQTVGGSLQRQGYYTWAYLLRRLQSSAPSTTELNVIVYKGRPVQTPSLEQTYAVVPAGNLGSTSVTLTWSAGQPAPDLKPGAWLLDATYEMKPNSLGYVHGRLYRVMAAVPFGNQVQVEVDPPLRDGNVQQMIFLEYAVEIFARGTGN